MDVVWAGSLLLCGAGGLLALPAVYLLSLAVAALRPPRAAPGGSDRSRIAVVVPAHNEAELLPRCLGSLKAQSYPACLTRIVVVADNCADATADIALASGAEVMARPLPQRSGSVRTITSAPEARAMSTVASAQLSATTTIRVRHAG